MSLPSQEYFLTLNFITTYTHIFFGFCFLTSYNILGYARNSHFLIAAKLKVKHYICEDYSTEILQYVLLLIDHLKL